MGCSKCFLTIFSFKCGLPYFLYFHSIQEINTGILETAKSFVSLDDWAKSFIKVLAELGYFLVCYLSYNISILLLF